MPWTAGQNAVLLCPGPKAGQVCWLGGPEDVRDNIVSVNAINQPSSIVVDEPAGHLSPMPGVIAVVFLQASGDKPSQLGSLLGPSRATLPRKPTRPMRHLKKGLEQQWATPRTEMLGEQPTHLVTVSRWPFTTIVASVFAGSEPGWRSDTL